MIVAKMEEKHLNEVIEIENKCFSTPWGKESFCDELRKENSFKFVALDSEKVIGFAILETVLDEGNLLDIAVDENFRRNGVAKALIEELFKVAVKNELSFITLEVRESSLPAITLYEKTGFEKVALRKNYYHKPTENAVLMTKYFKKV